VATFSTAAGLVCWPVGFLLLYRHSFSNEETRRRALFLWFLVGFTLIGASVILYKKPLHSPPLEFTLQYPLQCLKYVLGYLGAPILFFQIKYAWLGGLAGVGLWVAASLLLIRSRLWEWKALVPYAGLALYAIGAGFLTGIGRAGFGYTQAFCPRYIVYSQFLWISVLALLYFLIVGNQAGRTRSIGISTVSILILLIAASSFRGVMDAARWHDRLLPARDALASMKNEELLVERAYLNPQRAKATVSFLREHHLSVFRNTAT